MSKEENRSPAKVIAKVEVAAKSIKHLPAKHILPKRIPAVHVFSTIDVLMDNLRRNYIENIAYPWDMVSLEPVIAVRKATIANSISGKRKFLSTLK